MSIQTPNIDILPRNALIIGDQRSERGSGQKHAHIYPATGTVTKELQLASADDVDAAVRAARAAFPAWRALPGDKRRDLMFKMAGVFEQHMQELAQLSVIENGSLAMVGPYVAMDGAQKFRYFGGRTRSRA